MRARAIPLALAGAVLVSCNPLLSGTLPGGMVGSALVQHVPYSGTFRYTVDPGSTPREVYFVFTNPSLSQDATTVPTVSGSIRVNGKGLPAPAAQPLPSTVRSPQTVLDRISEFNRNPRAYLPARSAFPAPSATVSPAGGDSVGSTGSFEIANPDGTNSLTPVPHVTCQSHATVTFADGRKRAISVWVDDTVFGTDVNTTSVDTLAARFLATTAESLTDIYHMDTSVVGEPWGPQSSPDLITWDANATVTILLTHLNATYTGPNGVIVGYFWAKDNFNSSAYAGSNQRIMFYIDSHEYAASPSLVYSTLAHEFQHMIQFYQKQVLRGASTGTDTWINEMCSMLMEDLVAYTLGVEGPRGVTNPTDGSAGGVGGTDSNSRIAEFNAVSNTSLAVTASGSGFGLPQYAVAYAFGSWLLRNCGGPDLLQRIVQCPQTDSTAVTNAATAYSGTAETMQSLLQRWAVSVLLSDTTTAPFGYRCNTGDWTTFTHDAQTFNLGSINFFNYTPAPLEFSSVSPISAPPYYSSNVYYKAATALSAPTTFDLNLPAGTVMSVVLK
ncbi:MAG TPA: hypothetical protein VMF68_01240 [Spirochaetia bacterium]|nr:hypothetical protein [Spirochaetia bacterium]